MLTKSLDLHTDFPPKASKEELKARSEELNKWATTERVGLFWRTVIFRLGVYQNRSGQSWEPIVLKFLRIVAGRMDCVSYRHNVFLAAQEDEGSSLLPLHPSIFGSRVFSSLLDPKISLFGYDMIWYEGSLPNMILHR